MAVTESSGFSAGGLAATLAGVAGVVLLVLAAVRFVDIQGESNAEVSLVTTTTLPGSATTPIDAGSFVAVSDDTGAVSVMVPPDWTDVSGLQWVVDGTVVGLTVTAATDIDAWFSTWGAPGAFVGVSTSGFTPEIGDFSSACGSGGRDVGSGGVLVGEVQSWSDCGGEGSDFFVFVGGPADGSYAVLIQLVDVDGTGVAVLQELLTTFSYG